MQQVCCHVLYVWSFGYWHPGCGRTFWITFILSHWLAAQLCGEMVLLHKSK